jgi:hypothetical protein
MKKKSTVFGAWFMRQSLEIRELDSMRQQERPASRPSLLVTHHLSLVTVESERLA